MPLGQHWSDGIHEVRLALATVDSVEDLPFYIDGGAEFGLFPFLTDLKLDQLHYETNNRLQSGEIVLAVCGRQVAGLTAYDIAAWVLHCVSIPQLLVLQTIRPGLLTKDLRQYLSMRFPKQSIDHDLQNAIRDNIYLRTVPCTTRPRRDGENDGVDYKFVSVDEFLELDKNQQLLEIGVFEGNYYGTPKPPIESPESGPLLPYPWSQTNSQSSSIASDFTANGLPVGSSANSFNSLSNSNNHKRVRNRTADFTGEMAPLFPQSSSESSTGMHSYQSASTVQETAGAPNKSSLQTALKLNGFERTLNGSSSQLHVNTNGHVIKENMLSNSQSSIVADNGFVSLPSNWEMAYTDKGEVYFIDHNTGTTHWTDPRLAKVYGRDQRPSVSDSVASTIEGSDLPTGWEKVDDPQYGVYFVDHINKRTQYERPSPAGSHLASSMSNYSALFTRDPSQLHGQLLSTTLLKGTLGLGFTLVGNDAAATKEEFLQIKQIILGGPAHKDARLKRGDILVYVNNACVLGYKQEEVIELFKSIAVGQMVKLQVCRGYPLICDPNFNDGVPAQQHGYGASNHVQALNSGSYSDLSSSATATAVNGGVVPLSTLPPVAHHHHQLSDNLTLNDLLPHAQALVVRIVKGDLGFGFTIADSNFGQKVKNILDRIRCCDLQEGDILVRINSKNVQRMSHAEIVEVLRDCAVGREAVIEVRRPQMSTLKHSEPSHVGMIAQLSTERGPPNVPMKPNRPISYHHPDHPHQNFPKGRSKTPTAEILSGYSSSQMSRSTTAPQLRTRSRTPGPTPNRPTKPVNGWVSNGVNGLPPAGSSSYAVLKPQYSTESDFGVPIYENLGGQHRSSANFASTPDYVPASVYAQSSRISQLNINSSAAPWEGMDMVEAREIVVNLIRQQNGFGFRIVGGSEEGTQVAVGEIVPGGAAALDGRLIEGDQVLEIDNQVVVGASHQLVIAVMAHATQIGHVKLLIRRFMKANSIRTPLPPIITGSGSNLPYVFEQRRTISTKSYPYDVNVTRSDNEGFGFVIISSVNRPGSSIGKIIPNSPAERCGSLRVGDRIIAVNGINILNMHHGDIVNLIKDSGCSVTLTVGPPEDEHQSQPASYGKAFVEHGPNKFSGAVNGGENVVLRRPQHLSSSHTVDGLMSTQSSQISPAYRHSGAVVDMADKRPRSLLHDSDILIKNMSVNRYDGNDYENTDRLYIQHPLQQSYFTKIDPTDDTASQSLTLPPGGSESYGASTQSVQPEYLWVELQRGANGYGFSIRGGREFSMPLFVLRIADQGPAAQDNKLQVGDQLCEINGASCDEMTHIHAIEIIKNASAVRLLIRRDHHM